MCTPALHLQRRIARLNKSGLTIGSMEVACTPRTNKELFVALRVVLLVLYTWSPGIQTHPPSSNIIHWWTGSLRVGAEKGVRTMASRMHESNLSRNVLSYGDNTVQGHTQHLLLSAEESLSLNGALEVAWVLQHMGEQKLKSIWSRLKCLHSIVIGFTGILVL